MIAHRSASRVQDVLRSCSNLERQKLAMLISPLIASTIVAEVTGFLAQDLMHFSPKIT